MKTELRGQPPMNTMQNNKAAGYIRLIIGCMFAGKSCRLVSDVERFHYAKKQCVIIKHSIDKRYTHLEKSGGIVCNDGVERNKIRIVQTASLTAIEEIVSGFDVIGVMESQFFDDLLLVDKWANSGKIIICDGLDGDSERRNFGQIHLLIPLCEEVIKLQAVCVMCGASAAFTKKLGGTVSGEVIDVGGMDKYMPVCRQCYVRR